MATQRVATRRVVRLGRHTAPRGRRPGASAARERARECLETATTQLLAAC